MNYFTFSWNSFLKFQNGHRPTESRSPLVMVPSVRDEGTTDQSSLHIKILQSLVIWWSVKISGVPRQQSHRYSDLATLSSVGAVPYSPHISVDWGDLLFLFYICILFLCIIVYLYVYFVVCVVWFFLCKSRLPYNLYCLGGDVKHYRNPIQSCKDLSEMTCNFSPPAVYYASVFEWYVDRCWTCCSTTPMPMRPSRGSEKSCRWSAVRTTAKTNQRPWYGLFLASVFCMSIHCQKLMTCKNCAHYSRSAAGCVKSPASSSSMLRWRNSPASISHGPSDCLLIHSYHWTRFYPRDAMLARVIAMTLDDFELRKFEFSVNFSGFRGFRTQ